MATLIDTALFLPEEWTRDRPRMKKAGVPSEAQAFRTKQELAMVLIERAVVNGVDFACIGFDGFYGSNGKFLRTIDTAGMTFMGDIHCDQRVWSGDPTADPNAQAMRVDQWVEAQPKEAWQRVVVRDGTKGRMEIDALHQGSSVGVTPSYFARSGTVGGKCLFHSGLRPRMQFTAMRCEASAERRSRAFAMTWAPSRA